MIKRFIKIEHLTIAIAMLALAVSAGSFYFTWQQSEKAERELVNVSLSPKQIIGGTVVLRRSGFPATGWTMQTPIPVLISNVGDRQVSIVSYEVYTGIGGVEALQHSYLDGGLLSKDGTINPLPITIEPGESVSCVLNIGRSIVPKAVKLLEGNFPMNTPIPYKEVSGILADSNLDHLGNKIEVVSFPSGGKVLSWQPSSDIVDQRFNVVWKTGQGKLIQSSASTLSFP